MISATADSTDWLFPEDHWGTSFAELDVYDRCIHLVPDSVFMMCRQIVTDRNFNLWSKGRRLIYFVNSVKGMVTLIEELNARGISNDDIGIAFSNSKNANLLPQKLLSRKNSLRDRIVQESIIPPEIKIFITTSQNKEGISIVDDDIKYMFSEAHNKADLEQMAGRVRGNPENGTGIHALVVVYDADDHRSQWEFLECELDRKIADQVGEIMEQHKTAFEQAGKIYALDKDIAAIQRKHRYLRYDYIKQEFCHFSGREMCENLILTDRRNLDSYIELYDEILYYYSDRSGYTFAATGRYELQQKWFPYSRVYYAPSRPTGAKEEATTALLNYLLQNNLIGVEITPEQVDFVIQEICRIITIYSRHELGFDRGNPQSLGPALRRFNMECTDTSHHNRNKIITLKRCP